MGVAQKTPLRKTLEIERRIFIIRGEKVMLDRDLAELYGVTTFNLNKAVARNAGRFPTGFAFKLNKAENRALRFQIGILEKGRHSKYPPRVFTEQGVSMLSSVLRSERAIRVNVAIMRAFVRLRRMASENKKLAEKLRELEDRVGGHDEAIDSLFDAIRRLTALPEEARSRIGFKPKS